MAYEGKPLKNISVVEFGIYNRTSRQFGDVDLAFSVKDSKSQLSLVSSGIITPGDLPHAEIVEEQPVKDTRTTIKIFRLKVIPKQRENEYFQAVFVFEGEKAPAMSVASLSKDVPIGAYQVWRDVSIPLLKFFGLMGLIGTGYGIVLSLISHFMAPRHHRKSIERFVQHADELQKNGELKSADEQAIRDASTVYASFTRPRPNRVWLKIFGTQHFDY
jgi:hypothetical protein